VAIQRLWTCQFSDVAGKAIAKNNAALLNVLQQLGESGEAVTISRLALPDIGSTIPNAVVVATTLIYSVPTAETTFDFEN
jgi:hypothetical protein